MRSRSASSCGPARADLSAGADRGGRPMVATGKCDAADRARRGRHRHRDDRARRRQGAPARGRRRAHRRRTPGRRTAPGAASCSPASRSPPRPPPSTASTPPSSPTRRPLPRCGRSLPPGSATASSSATRWASIIAVLKRECELAGISWQHPRLLDTRLLAQVAKPDLAGYSLDQVASWLGVEVVRPAFGARRCDDHRARLPGPGAEAARARHPHAGRGHARPAAR